MIVKKILLWILLLFFILIIIPTASSQINLYNETYSHVDNIEYTVNNTQTLNNFSVDHDHIEFNNTHIYIDTQQQTTLFLEYLHSNPQTALLDEKIIRYTYNTTSPTLWINISNFEPNQQYQIYKNNTHDQSYTTTTNGYINYSTTNGLRYIEIYKTINHNTNLSNATVQPNTGVDSYTNFSFNITWKDIDGDTPADGYLHVNITKAGWYKNQTLIYIHGDNATGANYTYNTTLPTGTYTYRFYSYDGISYNHSGPHNGPIVTAQSHALGITQCHHEIWFNATGLNETGVQNNVSAYGQNNLIPALELQNQGNVPINMTIEINASEAKGITLKWDLDNNPTGSTNITTIPVNFSINLAVNSIENIWMWTDFYQPEPGATERKVNITTNKGSW